MIKWIFYVNHRKSTLYVPEPYEKKQKLKIFGKSILPLSCFMLFHLTACGPDTAKEQSSQVPDIFPDYKNVTVPCNIAPMNFMMEHASKIRADFYVDNRKLFTVSGKNSINIPEKNGRKVCKPQVANE